MKFFLILFLMCFALYSCQKQQKYLIQGDIRGIPDSTVIYLLIQHDNIVIGKAKDTIIGGKFSFSDTLEIRPTKMVLMVSDNKKFSGSCYVWVDYNKIKVTGEGRFLSGWTVNSNVKEQNTLNKILYKTKYLSIIGDSLSSIHNGKDKEFLIRIRAEMDSIYQIKSVLEFDAISKDYNSFSAVEILYYITQFSKKIPQEKISKVYNKMDTIYKNSIYGKGILSLLKEKEVPLIYGEMIDAKLLDLDGNPHKLSDYKGNFILLDFWSFGCKPCAMAAPELRKISRIYSDDLSVISLNVDTDKELWKKASTRDSITWLNFSDGMGIFSGVGAIYSTEGLPTYYLINPDGIIVEKWLGFAQGIFEKKLSKYFKERN